MICFNTQNIVNFNFLNFNLILIFSFVLILFIYNFKYESDKLFTNNKSNILLLNFL